MSERHRSPDGRDRDRDRQRKRSRSPERSSRHREAHEDRRRRSRSRERRSRSPPRKRDSSHDRRPRSRSPQRRRGSSRSRSRSPRRRESRWGDQPAPGHHPHQHQHQHQHQQRLPSPPPRANLPPRGPPLSDLPPAVGSIHKGTVHTIRPFGIFVQLQGYRKHALVHHSQIHEEIRFTREETDEDKVKALEFFLPKGAEVKVKVTEVSPDLNKGPHEVKVHGSIRAVDQDTGEDLDPSNKLAVVGKPGGGGGPLSDQPPELGAVLRGTVKRIEPYGVFVAMEGFRKFGLVHSSQVSNFISFSREDTDEEKKAELAGVVSLGDAVFVKVVEVIEDDGSGRGPKIQCSMKLVDQKSGEDLDPMMTRYKPRGQGGEGGRGGPPGALGSDAGVVVGGRVAWGHLAGDVKLHAGEQANQYKLLDAAKEEGAGPPPPPPAPSRYEMVHRGPSIQHDMLLDGGQLPPPPPLPSGGLPPPPKQISSVEEAVAILMQAAARKSKKSKKDKDKSSKKKDKDKSKKHKKEKKSKKQSRKADKGSGSSSDDSSSGSDS